MRHRPVSIIAVAALFLGSGAAALLYELVWYQLLRYVVGASSVSLSLTLASFMAGLGLGAWLAPRCIGVGRHPLRVYAALEAGIGVCGLVMPWLVPALGLAYARVVSGGAGDAVGFNSILARGAVCALALGPPAMLMGATLPAIARWVRDTREGAGWLGLFYALNTLGATLGVLAGGFLLMPTMSLTQVTALAVALNMAVAAMAWAMSGISSSAREDHEPHGATPPDASDGPRPTVARVPDARIGAVLLGIAGSGVVAMGCQVVWTRLLSAILAVTVYTFAIILAVFLFGLAVGGAFGGSMVRRTRRPGVWLAVSQALSVPAVLWAFWAIGHGVPRWSDWNAPLTSPLRQLLMRFGLYGGDYWPLVTDLERVGVALLPATLCWGAAVPLAIAAGWDDAQRERGRWTGRVYAWNTGGAIAGALGVGLVAMPTLGSAGTAKLLTALPCLVAVGLMLAMSRPDPAPADGDRRRLRLRSTLSEFVRWTRARISETLDAVERSFSRHALPATLVGLALGAALTWVVPGVPQSVLIGGRKSMGPLVSADIREGLHTTAVATTNEEGLREMWVSGKVVASTLVDDMRLQRMLGHVAAAAHGRPRSALIVGLGTGTTAGCFVDHPSIERIVICEIEPRVVDLAREHFAVENRRVLDDPRTQIVFDDARHFLATTDETFDVITSDPIHPWVKGAAALYSRQYYDLVKQHLNRGGVVTQWVPFYETSDAAVYSMLATFFDAFPQGTLWHAGPLGKGNDVVMLARPDAPRLDLNRWAETWDERPSVAQAFAEVLIDEPADLFRRLAGDAETLRPWLAGAAINIDSSLRLEYLAGMGRRSGDNATPLYLELMRQRRLPELLAIDAATRDAVEALWRQERDPDGRAPK